MTFPAKSFLIIVLSYKLETDCQGAFVNIFLACMVMNKLLDSK